MADSEKLKDKLRLYLSTLSDSAQKLLLRSLEQAEEQGNNDAASDLILLALREVLKGDEPDIILEDAVKEEFFKASKPFTCEVDHIEKMEARLSPSSIEGIWKWIKRDIATPEQQKVLKTLVNGFDEKEINIKAIAVVDALNPAIKQYVNSILREIGGEQKICNQLGGEQVFRDLKEVLICPEILNTLKPTLEKLPAEIPSWSGEEGGDAYIAVSRFIQGSPMKAGWLFSAITNRLASSKLRVQIATKLAGSDDAGQVAATVYAPAIKQVLADMEAHLKAFDSKLHQPLETSVDHLLKWRSMAKALEVELELSPQGNWGKILASMKKHLSNLLESEIEAAPGLVRQALRAPKAGAHETADENLINDAKRAVELFHHSERMKDSLALNGPITRIRKELDQTFEILTTSLIDRSRNAVGADADACLKLGEAATDIAKHLFDEKYAIAFKRQINAASSTKEMLAAEG